VSIKNFCVSQIARLKMKHRVAQKNYKEKLKLK